MLIPRCQSKSTIPRKLGIMLSFIVVVILITAYVSYLLGGRYFLLPTDKICNETLATWITALLFICNVFLLTKVLTNLPTHIALVGAGLYLPIYFLADQFLVGSQIASTLIPHGYILLLLLLTSRKIYKRDLSLFVMMWGISAILIIPYQCITGVIKLGIEAELGHYFAISALAKILYSIDFFLFLGLLIFLKGGILNGRYLESLLFPQSVEAGKPDREDAEAYGRVSKLPQEKRITFTIALYAFQILQLLFILMICAVGNVFVEGMLITLTFILSGTIIKRRWHSNSVLICTLLAAFIFYVAAKLSVPVGISLLFPVAVGFLICYSLYRVAIHK